MLATLSSAAVLGINGFLVEVEVDLSHGLPSFDLVGLADTAVKEAKERVRAAVKNSDYQFPIHRIVVNLAPADIKKEGGSFDLPIALGILSAQGYLNAERLAGGVVLGELALDGSIRAIRGALPMTFAAGREGKEYIILPAANYQEAKVVKDIKVIPITHLRQAVEYINSGAEPEKPRDRASEESFSYEEDFSEVKGQESAKRALEIAAAGRHNLLMVGAPGSGKTMLARRLPTILPALTWEESVEITKIYSIAGLLSAEESLLARRPFRSPHHTTSKAGMIGGGKIPKPGEVTLAHHGVLFLDELPEFSREVLESLRQPLEDRKVTLSRSLISLSYPASFMLVCAMNPCPCGFSKDQFHSCSCTPLQIKRYRSRISGPLLDRIDFKVEVPRLKHHEIMGVEAGESSNRIRERVEAARQIQAERFRGMKLHSNAEMGPKELKRFCEPTKEGRLLMASAIRNFGISARGYSRLLKVSRTIADLAGEEKIDSTHLAEAIQFRGVEKT